MMEPTVQHSILKLYLHSSNGLRKREQTETVIDSILLGSYSSMGGLEITLSVLRSLERDLAIIQPVMTYYQRLLWEQNVRTVNFTSQFQLNRRELSNLYRLTAGTISSLVLDGLERKTPT